MIIGAATLIAAAIFRRGFRLGTGSEYPCRDQKMARDWRNLLWAANGAEIFIGLLFGACAIL